MSTTTILITGGNRGLGKGMLTSYLARPNHTVITFVRDPSHSTSQDLSKLPVGANSSLIIIPFDASSDTSPAEAVKILTTKHSISELNVVIANAAIASFPGTALNTPLDNTREQFSINVVGPLALFQAVYPLLKKSVEKGQVTKFVTITSTVGSVGEMEKMPMYSTAYGASKAALNYVTRKIHFENPEFVVFPLNPGWVKTDMGNAGATAHGMTEAPTEIQDSIDGLVSTIDKATRDNSGGKFMSYEGDKPGW